MGGQRAENERAEAEGDWRIAKSARVKRKRTDLKSSLRAIVARMNQVRKTGGRQRGKNLARKWKAVKRPHVVTKKAKRIARTSKASPAETRVSNRIRSTSRRHHKRDNCNPPKQQTWADRRFLRDRSADAVMLNGADWAGEHYDWDQAYRWWRDGLLFLR